MRGLRAIAGITWHETLKQPTTWVLTLVAAALILLLPLLTLFALGQEAALLKEMGLQTIALATIAITLLGAANVVTRELEQRTLLTLLAKPVTRGQVIVGKYLGLVALNLGIALVLGLLLLAALIGYHATERASGSVLWERAAVALEREAQQQARPVEQAGEAGSRDDWGRTFWTALRVAGAELPEVAAGLYLTLWQMAILAAVLVAGSTLLPAAANAVLAVVVYLAGHLADTLALALGGGEGARAILILLPNLRVYDMGELYNRQLPLPFDVAFWGTVAGMLYVCLYLAVGCVIVNRRDIG